MGACSNKDEQGRRQPTQPEPCTVAPHNCAPPRGSSPCARSLSPEWRYRQKHCEGNPGDLRIRSSGSEYPAIFKFGKKYAKCGVGTRIDIGHKCPLRVWSMVKPLRYPDSASFGQCPNYCVIGLRDGRKVSQVSMVILRV